MSSLIESKEIILKGKLFIPPDNDRIACICLPMIKDTFKKSYLKIKIDRINSVLIRLRNHSEEKDLNVNQYDYPYSRSKSKIFRNNDWFDFRCISQLQSASLGYEFG